MSGSCLWIIEVLDVQSLIARKQINPIFYLGHTLDLVFLSSLFNLRCYLGLFHVDIMLVLNRLPTQWNPRHWPSITGSSLFYFSRFYPGIQDDLSVSFNVPIYQVIMYKLWSLSTDLSGIYFCITFIRFFHMYLLISLLKMIF